MTSTLTLAVAVAVALNPTSALTLSRTPKPTHSLWFFQYSVMGFIFQLCDRSLSNALSVEPVAYGEQP